MLFSTRRGGVSGGPYASLNLGRLTDDDGANVDANRDRLAAAVGLPRERFLYGKQVHGARVRRATGPMGRHAEEDGQATAQPDLAALVFVADCLPVMLAAHGGVAALHGGWRGLAGGIVAEGVAALRELGVEGRADRGARTGRPRLLLRGGRGGPRGLRGRPGRARGRAQPRSPRGRPARADEPQASGRCTTPGCARCATSASSPTGATAGSRAARRGSCGGARHRGGRARTSPACARRSRRPPGARAATPAASSCSPR